MKRSAAFAQLLDAGDRERAALSYTLHGRILQSLAAAAMNLSVVGPPDEHARMRAALTDCVRLIGDSISDVRALSYCVEAPFVKDLGMGAALEAYAAAFERVHERPFAVSGIAPRCAALKDDLATAFVHGIRDAACAFVEAGAIAFRASAADDGESLTVCLKANFEERAAVSGFGLVSAIAVERVRRLDGAANVELSDGCATLVMRASPRRSS